MNRFAILAIVLAAVALFVVWIAGSALQMPESHEGSARLVYSILMAVMLITSLVLGWRGTFGEAMKSALFWFAAFVALILAYSYRNDLKPLADRVSGELNPAAPVSRVAGEVVLRRANDGHFYADVSVNGTDMRMLADTGASVIALSVADAENAGIDVDQLNFDMRLSTANGMASAARVRLDEVRIGNIVRQDVTAVVSRGLSQSLLGMNFFSSLSKFQIENDELLLKD